MFFAIKMQNDQINSVASIVGDSIMASSDKKVTSFQLEFQRIAEERKRAKESVIRNQL